VWREKRSYCCRGPEKSFEDKVSGQQIKTDHDRKALGSTDMKDRSGEAALCLFKLEYCLRAPRQSVVGQHVITRAGMHNNLVRSSVKLCPFVPSLQRFLKVFICRTLLIACPPKPANVSCVARRFETPGPPCLRPARPKSDNLDHCPRRYIIVHNTFALRTLKVPALAPGLMSDHQGRPK